jgi:uncharacterized RDD family membrane protein YckC
LTKHCPNPSCPHLEATGEAAEFRNDIKACSDCGTPLEIGDAASAVDQQAGHSNETEIARFVTIATFRDPHVAQMAKGRLESEGIKAFVAEEGSLEGLINVRGERAGLQVRETDARRAIEILDSWPVKPEFFYEPPQLVSAEIKRTDRAASGEITLAGRGTRLVALFLDASITFLLVYVLLRGLMMPPTWESPRVMDVLLMAFVFCSINWGGLSRNGQTIGKKLMRIRIVGIDGYLPASRILARRYFPWLVLSALPFFGLLFAFVDALFIFRTDRRCIHDFIGGTMVVKA